MRFAAMTIGALSGAAFLGSAALGSGALAADLYTPPVYQPMAPAPAPLADDYFSGFYIGLHGGWGWADAPSAFADDDFNEPDCGLGSFNSCAVDLKPDGAFVGAQVGYNFVMPSGLMIGVEGDYSFASLSDSATELWGDVFFLGVEESHTDLEVDQMATVQARLGFAMGQWMPFLTGGWGWAHAERTVNSSFPEGFSTSASNWHDGWTVGGGAEYAINEHWTVKGEYRYFDGGEETYGSSFAGGTKVDLSIHTVRFGVNLGF